MTALLRLDTDAGQVIVEIAEDDPGLELVGRNGVMSQPRRKRETAPREVRVAAESALGEFGDGSLNPDSLELAERTGGTDASAPRSEVAT